MAVWFIPPTHHLLHVRVPTLTRHMKQEHVNDFLDRGRLRLTSLESFRKHPDEALSDGEEGVIDMSMSNPNAQGQALLFVQQCYVMCTSSNQFDPDRVAWNADSGFRIIDPIGFSNAIAGHVPGFKAGHVGACDYTDEPDVVLNSDEPLVPPDKHPGGPDGYFREMMARQEKHAIPGLFSKARRFLPDSEYRFLWFTDGKPEQELFIDCPEARGYCAALEP